MTYEISDTLYEHLRKTDAIRAFGAEFGKLPNKKQMQNLVNSKLPNPNETKERLRHIKTHNVYYLNSSQIKSRSLPKLIYHLTKTILDNVRDVVTKNNLNVEYYTISSSTINVCHSYLETDEEYNDRLFEQFRYDALMEIRPVLIEEIEKYSQNEKAIQREILKERLERLQQQLKELDE